MFSQETLELLEFPAILDQLASFARTNAARTRILALRPMQSPNDIAQARQKTASARRIHDAMGMPPVHSLEGIEKAFQTLRMGEILSISHLKNVASFLNHCKLLYRFAERAMTIDTLVAGYGMSISPLPEVQEEIDRCIRGDEIEDHASKQLRSIRLKRAQVAERIKEKLSAMLRAHPQWFQESFAMQRGGCEVLPVKREYRSQIQGSVVDASATGATVFIEPSMVKDLRQQMDLLTIEEANEVMRILADLTAMVASHTHALNINQDAMIEIDFAMACGRMGSVMRGVEAKPTAKCELLLVKARHPLLSTSPVPLTLSLQKIKGLIITGPNTGGKTVALKTVGLLTLMSLCGLQVPADEAVIPMFSGVYCDIGDGQSISQNLSTFSSHVKRLVGILSAVDGKSLVLLDELGSGTDPQEGMGLAVAILEELGRRSCLLVVTSHYPEIKRFAQETHGFLNARMTFDRVTLSPLYQLEMGSAGESCALYIAKRLGMEESLLKRAWQVAYPQGEAPREENALELPEQEMQASCQEGITTQEDMALPSSPTIAKEQIGTQYKLGDGVYVSAMKAHGIVSTLCNARGEVGVRIQGKNYVINHKRLKPFISAKELYPDEDYDLDIVLSSWEQRQNKRDIAKGKTGAVSIVDDHTKD